jgi:hypothetical protein
MEAVEGDRGSPGACAGIAAVTFARCLERAAESMDLHDRIPYLRERFKQALKVS